MSQSEQPKQVYAYIDSQNLNVTTQKDGWKMNWQKFRQWLADEYGVTKAYMFIGYVPEFEAMYEQLHQLGYSIVLKPTFDMTRVQDDETKETKQGEPEPEKRPVKGNIDAELVLWAMKDFNTYDKAIVVSGDGDFYCLVEYLDEQKKLLKLLAPTRKYSSLYNKYEQYVERLDHHRRQLEYRDRRRRPASKDTAA
ncbi:hypothetical protein BH09PAT4_BH09PAT4_04160 [soil metagenome]